MHYYVKNKERENEWTIRICSMIECQKTEVLFQNNIVFHGSK